MVRSVVRDSEGQSSRSWEVMSSWSSKPRKVSQKVRHLPLANTKSLLANPGKIFPPEELSVAGPGSGGVAGAGAAARFGSEAPKLAKSHIRPGANLKVI